MIEGIVTSLEIHPMKDGMGNRGSKSDSPISVKEQRADGSSIALALYCKVCSESQGNLVFICPIKNFNTVISTPRNSIRGGGFAFALRPRPKDLVLGFYFLVK